MKQELDNLQFAMPWGHMSYYVRQGETEPFLFLHGSGCDSLDWNCVTNHLPDSTSAVLADFRGHGNSDLSSTPFTIEDLAADIMKLIDCIELENTTIVGHSLGGMVAIDMLRAGYKPKAAVLVEGWTSLLAGAAFRPNRFYGSLTEEEQAPIKQKGEETRSRIGKPAWDHFWQSVIEFNGYDVLEKTDVPILELYGEMGKHEKTVKKLRIPPNPKIRLEWIPAAGHYLPLEAPAALVSAITDASHARSHLS